MAEEKRSIVLDLLARNKMGSETTAAARDVDKLGTAADQASKKTEKLSETTVIAGKETKKLGNSAEDTKRRISDMDQEIRNSTRELGALAVAFHEAGSQAEKMDVSKAMRRTEADIRRTTKAKGILAGLLPSPEELKPEGRKIGQGLAQSIRDGLTLARGYAIAGAVGIGVAIAPQLGAAVAGAIVGGVGVGGIIGGVALAASSDEKIKAYASRIGKSFVSGVQKDARDAFSGPIMQDLGKVEALATRAGAALGKIFKNVAPYLDPFVDNLVRASDVLLGSFVNASSKAGGPLKSLGNLVENVAIKIGHLIDVSAANSKAGASGLDFLASAIGDVVDAATYFVFIMSKVQQGLGALATPFKAARNWLEDHGRFIDLTNDGYRAGTEAAELYRKGLIGVNNSATDYTHYLAAGVESTNKLTEAQSNERKAALGQRDALKAVADQLRANVDPAFALLSAQDNLRTKQDALTEATKKYGAKSTEARSAARDLASAAIDLQGAAGSLSAKFDGKLTPAMRHNLETAGLNADQIAAVAEEFRRAKSAGDAYAKTYRAKVITDYINRYSSVVTDSAMSSYEETKKSLKKRAAGGPISRGTPYLVGENGPEVVVPSAAGRVLSAAGSRGMARAGMAGTPVGGRGGGVRAVQLEVIGEQQMISFFRYLIKRMNLLEA